MPSQLDRAIAATRRGIAEREAPVRTSLVETYERTIDDLLIDLREVTQLIDAARANGVEISPSWLQQEARYQRLINLVNAELARFAGDGSLIVNGGQTLAAQAAVTDAGVLMTASGMAVSLNTSAVERLVSSLTGPTPVRDILSRYGPEAARTITQGLTSGMARGLGAREIERQLRRELLADGIEARLDALVRTEMMRSFRGSLNETYSRMSHLIEGYRWCASHSVRTCLACLAMDGDISREPHDRFHVACRCIDTPVPRGVVIPYETGRQWFDRQPAMVQRRMMPSTDAYQAYRGGQVQLVDFAGVRSHPVYGESVYERSGVDALRRAS